MRAAETPLREKMLPGMLTGHSRAAQQSRWWWWQLCSSRPRTPSRMFEAAKADKGSLRI
jgi:hypothetical protein